jgi:hypothetical protein
VQSESSGFLLMFSLLRFNECLFLIQILSGNVQGCRAFPFVVVAPTNNDSSSLDEVHQQCVGAELQLRHCILAALQLLTDC